MGDTARDNYECVDIANPYEHRADGCVTCLKKRLRALEHELADTKKLAWIAGHHAAACHKCHKPFAKPPFVTVFCEECKNG